MAKVNTYYDAKKIMDNNADRIESCYYYAVDYDEWVYLRDYLYGLGIDRGKALIFVHDWIRARSNG